MRAYIRSLLVCFILGLAFIFTPAQSTWARPAYQTIPTAPPTRPTATAVPARSIDPEKLARWCTYLRDNPDLYLGRAYRQSIYGWRLSKLKLACQKLWSEAGQGW